MESLISQFMKTASIFLILFILSFGVSCFAKLITILDGESNPVPGAYASLINAADSTIYDVAVSDAEGMVNFSSKPDAACDIYVKCLWYKPFKGAFSDELAEVVLEDDATELGEVVVKGSGSSLKRTAGKFTFDPASLREISRNSLDIIKLTPLVEVDGNQFSIIGKGVSKVYINGRDPKMDSNTLVEMLKSLTPQQVKSVEIITAPGSSHSASYTGGIINVIIDRPNQGYRGSLSSDVRYRHERVSPTVSSWNSYAHEKLNISLSAAYNGEADHNVYSNTYDYTDIGRTVENKNSSSSWGNYAYARAGAEYSFTPKSTLGAALSIIAMQSSSTSDLQSTTTTGGVETSSRYTIKNEAPWIRPYYGAIAYYTLKTDDKGSNSAYCWPAPCIATLRFSYSTRPHRRWTP